MDIYDHPINQRISFGEFPLKQLYPCSITNSVFFDFEELSKSEISLFVDNPEFFNYLFLCFKQQVNALEKLNDTEVFIQIINIYINAKCPSDYLSIGGSFNDILNIQPVVTSLDKVLWYGIYMYSLEGELNPDSSENTINMMYAWIYLLLKAQETEIKTGYTIDVDKTSLSTNMIELILNDFQGSDASICIRKLTEHDLTQLFQIKSQRESLMAKIQDELKVGLEIAKNTEKEWKLFLQIINDLANKERQVVKRINKSDSPKDKIKKIHEYHILIFRIEKGKYILKKENINLLELLSKVSERFAKAQAFTQVRCLDQKPFRLNPIVFSLFTTPKNTVTYLYISFHQFRLEPTNENAVEFASLALNCIKRNLDIKEEKNNISLDDYIQDFYYAVDFFIKKNSKAIDKLSFDRLQKNVSIVLRESSDAIILKDIYNEYISKTIEGAKNNAAYQKALSDLENGILPIIDINQTFEQFSVIKAEMDVLDEKALATKIVLSLNIIYLFCDAIRIMLNNKQINISNEDNVKKHRKELLKIDNALVNKVYAHLAEHEIGMLEYREQYGLDTKNLTDQEKQVEQFRNSTVAEVMKENIGRLACQIESKSIEQILATKSEIKSEINRFPDCDNKEYFANWLDDINNSICNALVNNLKKQTDDFQEVKDHILISLGESSKKLPISSIDSLTTAEMLYNRYANDDFASNGFDYSCISALYYQAFEDAYNALIWGDYSKYLNSLIIDGQLYTNILHKHKYDDKKSIFNEPNAHGYLFDDKKYKRDYYIDYGKKSSDTKIKSKCMYKSFANIMAEINIHSSLLGFCDYFSKLSGYSGRQEMFNDSVFMNNCKEFTDRIFNSTDNRNNASHGGTSINIYQCNADKKTVLSDLEKVRSDSVGLVQRLLYLMQNSH